MLYCCGRYFNADQIIILDDDIENGFIQRKLEIGYCPNCKNRAKNKVAEYTYFDIRTGKREPKRPKKRDRAVVDAFIRKYEAQRSLLNELRQFKQGTKSNQAFIYGVNVELKDRIRQYAEDFNGSKKLVKEILIHSS